MSTTILDTAPKRASLAAELKCQALAGPPLPMREIARLSAE
ncbi:hypothetical protein [Pandoraea eparura]|jgi:hypothetical protein|nr:hypothetical protein [Pandoraea eparura]